MDVRLKIFNQLFIHVLPFHKVLVVLCNTVRQLPLGNITKAYKYKNKPLFCTSVLRPSTPHPSSSTAAYHSSSVNLWLVTLYIQLVSFHLVQGKEAVELRGEAR